MISLITEHVWECYYKDGISLLHIITNFLN